MVWWEEEEEGEEVVCSQEAGVRGVPEGAL